MLEFMAYTLMGVITGFIIYLMCYNHAKNSRGYKLDHETVKSKVIGDELCLAYIIAGAALWPISITTVIPGIFFVKLVSKGYVYLIDKIYGEKKNDK